MRAALFLYAAVVLLCFGCSSKTSDKITAFTSRVCACKDAACAQQVQAEYLEWWKKNKSAGGLDEDRKEVEDAMARYAACHLDLVGPEAASKKPAPVKPAAVVPTDPSLATELKKASPPVLVPKKTSPTTSVPVLKKPGLKKASPAPPKEPETRAPNP